MLFSNFFFHLSPLGLCTLNYFSFLPLNVFLQQFHFPLSPFKCGLWYLAFCSFKYILPWQIHLTNKLTYLLTNFLLTPEVLSTCLLSELVCNHWTFTPESKISPPVYHLAHFTHTVNAQLLLRLLSHLSRVTPVQPHRRQPTRLPGPWDSPGKNTGVGCYFLLQCVKVKSESEVAQSRLTRSDRMDCSLTGSSDHGIFQARVLKWGAIAFSQCPTKPPNLLIYLLLNHPM